MDAEWILGLVIFSILHLTLAFMLLQDLVNRDRVLGGHKAPWAFAILLFTFVGSIIYLLCHPKIFYDKDNK